MKDMQEISTYVALFLFALLAAWLLWLIFAYANQLLIGLLVAVASLSFAIWKYRDDKKKEHQNWLLRNKDAFLIEIINIVIMAAHSKGAIDMEKHIKLIQPALIAHGSKDLLEAWEDMQKISEEPNISKNMVSCEKFLRALRKDLGHKDSAIPPGHILKVMIKPDDQKMLLEAFKGVKYD